MPKSKRGRPPLPPTLRRVTLTVRVRPGVKAEIERRSAKTGRSQGEVVDEAIDP